LSSYDENKAALIAKIPVRPCRGPRQPFLPFRENEEVLLAALIRAEHAFNNAVAFEEHADRCAVLEGTSQAKAAGIGALRLAGFENLML
jgi:hypothetical protein